MVYVEQELLVMLVEVELGYCGNYIPARIDNLGSGVSS